MLKQFTILSIIILIMNNYLISQVPRTINYQGVLTDENGIIVPNGNYDMTIKIYNTEIGGTALWNETQSVPVEAGVYDIVLGNINQINLSFEQQYWIGITVGSEPELTPRLKFTAVPYSFNSHSILDNAVSSTKILDGTVLATDIAANEIVKSVNGIKDNINLLGSGSVNITSSGNTITINGTSGSGTIGGSGSYAYVPLFSDTYTLTNSNIHQDPWYGDIIVGNDGVRTQLTLSANNNDNEGGQINWNGAASYDDWYQDLYFNNMRLRSLSANDNMIEIFNSHSAGTSGLYVEGNVGIGTSTPSAKLDVRGDIRTGLNGSGGILFLASTNNSGEGGQIIFNGSPVETNGWVFDSFLENMRLFPNSALNNSTIEIGNMMFPSNIHIVHQRPTNWGFNSPRRGLTIENNLYGNLWSFLVEADPGFPALDLYFNDELRGYFYWPDGEYHAWPWPNKMKNIRPMNNVLDKIMQLQPRIYEIDDKNNSVRTKYGLIPSDVDKVLPDIVTKRESFNQNSQNESSSISYNALITLLIKAIQEQQTMINELQQKIEQINKE